MRTIVALFTGALAVAQTPVAVERLESRLAAHPENAAERQAFSRPLSPTPGAPVDQWRATRRALILWLIEHQPETSLFESPNTRLWRTGKLGDAEGFDRASESWREQAAKPGASGKAVGNAALFFAASNPEEGMAILDRADAAHPGDADGARARGALCATMVLGVSGIVEGSNYIHLATSPARRASPDAADALRQIEAAKDPHVAGAAGEFIARNGVFEIPFDLSIGDSDVIALSERWLRKAKELDPGSAEWDAALGNTLHRRAQGTSDAGEKLRLLNEARTLLPERQKANVRSEIAEAEFLLSDDAAASRDAQPLIEEPRNAGEYMTGEAILGRLALERGEIAEAKQRLLASLHPPAKLLNPAFTPHMDLAQDLYDAGEHAAVIEFLEASRAVWKNERGRIDRMIGYVQKAPAVDLARLSRQFPGSELLRRPAPRFDAPDRERLSGKVVALEFGDSPVAEKVARNFEDRGVALMKIQDPDTKRRFEVLTEPTVVVVDRQGNVSAFRSGAVTEAELARDLESAMGLGPAPAVLAAPKQLEGEGTRIAWEPVEGAESYVVEWDTRDERGWNFDRDKTVRVIPTRDCSVDIEAKGFNEIRWRVYAVPLRGQPGEASAWLEISGSPFTKIYK